MPSGQVNQVTHQRIKNQLRAWKAKAQCEQSRAEQAEERERKAEARADSLEEEVAQYDMQRIDDLRRQDQVAAMLRRHWCPEDQV